VFGGFDEQVEGGAQVGVGVDDVGAGTAVVALPFGSFGDGSESAPGGGERRVQGDHSCG
jgi:hypothetical protein